MTAHARWEYVTAIYPRYRQAPRREKQQAGNPSLSKNQRCYFVLGTRVSLPSSLAMN